VSRSKLCCARASPRGNHCEPGCCALRCSTHKEKGWRSVVSGRRWKGSGMAFLLAGLGLVVMQACVNMCAWSQAVTLDHEKSVAEGSLRLSSAHCWRRDCLGKPWVGAVRAWVGNYRGGSGARNQCAAGACSKACTHLAFDTLPVASSLLINPPLAGVASH